MGEVIPFARAVMQAAAGPWTQAERIELARLAAAITRDGRAGYDVASGRGDGGEPWFAISMPTSGETVLHVARIGGRFIVHHVADDLAEEGHDLRALVRRAMRDVGDNLGGLGPGAAVLLLLAQAALDVPSAAADVLDAVPVQTLATPDALPVGELVDLVGTEVLNIPAAMLPLPAADGASPVAEFAAMQASCVVTGTPVLAPPPGVSGAPVPRLAGFGDTPTELLGRWMYRSPADALVTPAGTSAATASDGSGDAESKDAASAQPESATRELSLALGRLVGTAGDDVIVGGTGNDWLTGGTGNDWLTGGTGSDMLVGGDGDDVLIGDDGGLIDDFAEPDPDAGGDASVATTVPGQPEPSVEDNDTLRGGDGDDTLWGGRGADSLRGGVGDDSLGGGIGDDRLNGEAGDDSLLGGAGHDWLFGSAGRDRLFGGTGNDTLIGGDGLDSLNGEAGDDRLAGGAGRDTLIGGAGRDTLFGGDGADCLVGGDDDDRINGGYGRDTLVGGDGNDTLAGGGGPDTLDGGSGDDVLFIDPGTLARGGLGADLFLIDFGSLPPVFSGGMRHAVIEDFNALAGDRYHLLDPDNSVVWEFPPELPGLSIKLLISWGGPNLGPLPDDMPPLPRHLPPFWHFDGLG